MNSFPGTGPAVQNYPHGIVWPQLFYFKRDNDSLALFNGMAHALLSGTYQLKNFEEASEMKKVSRTVFSALSSLALAAACVALPATHNAKQQATHEQAAQTQSVSGKIATVEKTSFTLTVGSGMSNSGQQMQQTAPKTMTFQIDKNTTVDGKLKVGANADVTYREDNGNNIAISVRVSQ